VSLFVLLAGAASGRLWAQSSGGPVDLCIGEDAVVMDVLDPAVDAARKSQPLGAMQSLAAAGCGDAAWVLGNLYRFGPELPGNPLPRDASRAGNLLEQAGLAGVEAAYRDLAELALADGRPRDAMLWTHVSLWLHNIDSVEKRKTAHGYDADLLRRVTRAWRAARLPNAQIQPLLDAYLGEHGAGILAARRGVAGLRAHRPRLALAESPRVHPGDIGPRSGYVMFRVEAKPSGEVTRTVVESYGPTAEVVERLRPLVKDLRLVPFDATESITGTLPIVVAVSP
jgi:hypothetical protein